MPELHRTGNATRDRMLQARDDFRTQNPLSAPQVQPQTMVPPAQPAPQQVAQAVPPQPVPQPEPPLAPQYQPSAPALEMNDEFIQSVASMGGRRQEPQGEPVPSQTDTPEVKAMREENAKLQKELEALRQHKDMDEQSVKELQQLRQQQRNAEYIKNLGELSIPQEDAIKLVNPLLNQVDELKRSSEERIREVTDMLDKRVADFDKKSQQQKANQVYAKIFKAHPDLQKLQSSAAYQEVMSSPISEGSLTTIGELVARELQSGNADYVIQVLNTVKQRQSPPDIAQFASVGGGFSAGNGAPSAPPADGRLTSDQLADLTSKVQTGQISRSEFRQAMAKHRGASKLR